MFQNKMHIFLFPVLPQRYPSLSLHIAIALTVTFVTYLIILLKKCNLEFVYPRSTQEFLSTRLIVSVRSWSNWNLEMLVFEEYSEKNLSQQEREPTTNSTSIWHTLGTRGFFSPASGSFVSSAAGRRHQRWSRIDPSQIGKRGKFSPLRKSCFPRSKR